MYLDDVIVYFPELDTHVHHLKVTFEQLMTYFLKLHPDRCVLFQRQVFGHLMSRDGIAQDPNKISSLQSWPVPHTVQHVPFFSRLNKVLSLVAELVRVARAPNPLLVGVPKNTKKGHSYKLG